jgi:hypothetical protein
VAHLRGCQHHLSNIYNSTTIVYGAVPHITMPKLSAMSVIHLSSNFEESNDIEFFYILRKIIAFRGYNCWLLSAGDYALFSF